MTLSQAEAEKLAHKLRPTSPHGLPEEVDPRDLQRLCDHILSGDMKREIAHDKDSTLVTKMARAIWKQMNFRGGDPTREWDTLTPDMQQPILDSCRVGLEAVHREIENAAYRRANSLVLKQCGTEGDHADNALCAASDAITSLITPAKTADTEG